MTPAVAVHGADPTSKPGLPSFWPGLEQVPAGLMTQVNGWLAEPDALSVTVATTEKVPAVVGVPEMTPVEALMVLPGGSPVAENVYGGVPPLAVRVRLAATPTVPVWLPGLVRVKAPPTVQVGSPAWAGTLTASHAALTVLNWVQLLGKRFFAACSVQVRYFRYELVVVLSSIALYMICMAVWVPSPVMVVLLQVGLVGCPLVGLVPC